MKGGASAAVVAWALAACAGAAYAQSSPVQPPAPVAATGSEGFVLPPVAQPTAPDSGLPTGAQTVTLRGLEVRGNKAIASTELASIAAGYLRRPLSAADLEELRQRLTRHYVDRGFVNSGAVFQSGALAGDLLTVDIIEGRLQLVRVSGLERLNESYVTDRLLGETDAPLNVETLRERFALLLEDPLFAQLNARLSPGAQLGEATLEIDAVRARPYQLQLFANNHRPPSVGDHAVGLNATIRNLTGLGDALDASVLRPEREAGRGRATMGWRVPVPRSTAEVFLQHEQGDSSVIETQLRPLDIRSELRSTELGVRYVLQESLKRKLSLGLSRLDRKNSTTLGGEPFSFTPEEPSGVTHVKSWRLWQELTLRSATQALALRSTFTHSDTNLQDIAGLPGGGAPRQPHSYAFWQGQVQFARELEAATGTQLVVRGTFQATSKSLVALDRIPVGGAATVRGFRENTLVRDQGVVFNIEVERPVQGEDAGWRLSLVPFLDAGWARNVGGSSDKLASLGVAVRFRWRGLSLDLALAHPLVRPSVPAPVDRTLQDRGVHLQVAYLVF